MKHVFFTLILSVTVFLAFSQSIERQVISSAGNSSTAGGIILSATVGEVVSTTFISGSVVLTQGFQQPDSAGTPVGISNDQKINVNYKIYPNPTNDKLIVELTSDKPAELIIQICDMSGKQVILVKKNIKVSGEVKDQIDMGSLASGNYILKMIYGKDAVRTFQVIKN